MDRPRAVKPRKIYVASSWRNGIYNRMLLRLRDSGHEVYDFRNPSPGNYGFHWPSSVPKDGIVSGYALKDELGRKNAYNAFLVDKMALDYCDTVVMILPCGNSAHLELGYAIGQRKDTVILFLDTNRIELMYALAYKIVLTEEALLDYLDVPLEFTDFKHYQ
jgi:hypothetical protein